MLLHKVLLLLFFIAADIAYLFCQPFNNDKILDSTIAEQIYADIAVNNGGLIGVCWVDQVPQGKVLNFARSTDKGESFIKTSVDSVLAWYEILLLNPKIIFDSKGNIWITVRYWDDNWGSSELLSIYKSTDGGETFVVKNIGLASRGYSQSITSDTLGNIYILWSPIGVYLRCTKIKQGNLNDTISTDLPYPGLWLESYSYNIVAQKNGENLYAVFGGGVDPDSNHYFTFKTFFIKSTNGGLSFSTPARIDTLIPDSVDQNYPYILLWNENLSIIMHDNRDGINKLYYTQSSDFGNSFSPVINISKEENGPVYFHSYLSGNSELLNVLWYSPSSYFNNVYFSQKSFQADTFITPITVGNPNYYQFNQKTNGIATDPQGFTYILFNDNRYGTRRLFLSKAKFTMTDVQDCCINEKSFHLYQNYPNPFNNSTIIPFYISSFSRVRLSIYNILGEEVVQLFDDQKYPGKYEIIFNTNQSKLSSGVYIYKLESGTFIEQRKLILLK